MAVQTPPAPADPTEPVTDDAEAGVIEDARARQWRHRRAGGILVATVIAGVALAAGSGGGGDHSGAGPRTHGGGPAPAPGSARAGSDAIAAAGTLPGYVSQMGLLAPGVGWVTSGAGFYVTRDGGRTWRDVGIRALSGDVAADLVASASPSPRALMLSVVDIASAYGTCADPIPSEPASTALPVGQTVVTTDSGRSWQSWSFPKCQTPDSVSFVNDRVGFTLSHNGRKPDRTPTLYVTANAARKWTRVGALPFEGSISFANARDGLGGGWTMGGGLVDSAAIYRTSDGGATWTQTPLCQPATVFECEAPSLFRSGRGVVLVTTRDEHAQSVGVQVDTTRNDGITWSAHVLPNTPALSNSGTYIPFSAPNANDLFAWISPYLYTSTDGGTSWSRRIEPLLAPPGAQQNLSAMDFVSAKYGWYGYGGSIDYTTDGGRHWTTFGRGH